VLGYGMGLASNSAVAPLFGKRTIAVMGDGGFWHNGLTNGVANAVYNKQDAVFVIIDNGYAAATGQHHVPSTGTNARGEAVAATIRARTSTRRASAAAGAGKSRTRRCSARRSTRCVWSPILAGGCVSSRAFVSPSSAASPRSLRERVRIRQRPDSRRRRAGRGR